MGTKVINILRSFHHYTSHYAQFPGLIRGIASNGRGGGKNGNKSRLSIIIDHLYLFFVLKVLPDNYYLFQFQSKMRKHFKEYMDVPSAPLLRHRLYETLWNDGYSNLVNDKYIFHCLCRYHDIPVPETYGICSGGILQDNDVSLARVMDKDGLDRVILKPVRGAQGKGIYFACRDDVGTRIKPAQPGGSPADPGGLKDGVFIVQEVVRQHHVLDQINPHCLNTIRIITLLTRDNGVEFLAAMLRTSSGETPVDNFSLGGIVVKVDIETGKLTGPGFLRTRGGTKVTRHPLTGTVFEGLQIPYWQGLKETVVKAQRVFSELKAIGWDLAVSPQGPVVIEGNIEWGTAGIQATNGGLLTPRTRSLLAQYGLEFY